MPKTSQATLRRGATGPYAVQAAIADLHLQQPRDWQQIAALYHVLARQTGVVKLLEGLHFTIGTTKRPEFGDLPLTTVAASVATVLPPDAD